MDTCTTSCILVKILRKGRLNDVLKLDGWIQELPNPPENLRLFSVSLRQDVIQIYRVAVWVGSIADLVHEATAYGS